MSPYLNGSSTEGADHAFQNAFADVGWQTSAIDDGQADNLIIVNANGQTYVAKLKVATEGRPDRVIGLFSQALLEARVFARHHRARAAVLIWVKAASPSLIKRIQVFRDQYAAGEAFGLISGDGVQHLDFQGLPCETVSLTERARRRTFNRPSQSRLVFSDCTQWMLKLLLAPEIPESLLTAKREYYRTATDLARAAGVSVMTASRFVNALSEKGFLDRTSQYMQLVMRRKLADLWKASYKNLPEPVPVKFLMSGPSAPLTEKLLRKHQSSFLGLFAAADALGVGYVHGVLPHVYVYDVGAAGHWKELKSVRDGEAPDLLLHQIRFPQSIGNGAVERSGVYVTDILQVWLDVSAHPTRGAEQAAELEHGVLANVIGKRT